MGPEHWPRELRRAPRVVSRFWVMVAGVDASPELRQGDLSVTGVFMRVRHSVGEAGTVQWLQVTSADQQESVAIMARVIRVIVYDDVDRDGPKAGVAFEFMPDNYGKRAALERLVKHVAFLHTRAHPVVIDHHFPVAVHHQQGPKEATVFHLSVHDVHLETTWPVVVGEAIQMEFGGASSGACLLFKGEVVSVRPSSNNGPARRYQVEVSLHASSTTRASFERMAPPRPLPPQESVDLVMSELMQSPRKIAASRKKSDLVGLLSRIQLVSLLSLLELEQLSGELQLVQAEAAVQIFVRDGRVIDALYGGRASSSPRATVREAMDWSEGKFRFIAKEIDRADRIGVPTTSLILDLVRQADEAQR